ncbi:hypothetical protein [Tumebacillus lipolyticus]|uniref:Uncharacterized protein n=1 Tax=Tumebacillus lipolyticus TaxID=1280370 RepID=A0ABW4ZWD3_9BACL
MLAKDGEIRQVVFAAKSKDGTVLTGHHNADPYTRQELIAHLQVKVTQAVMEAYRDDE